MKAVSFAWILPIWSWKPESEEAPPVWRLGSKLLYDVIFDRVVRATFLLGHYVLLLRHCHWPAIRSRTYEASATVGVTTCMQTIKPTKFCAWKWSRKELLLALFLFWKKTVILKSAQIFGSIKEVELRIYCL